MKRKLVVLLSFLMLVCFAIAACQKTQEPPPSGPADTVSPVISGIEDQMTGVKGRVFVLPAAQVSDNVDTSLTYTVEVKDPKSTAVELTDKDGAKQFTPGETGDYFATYRAQDAAGNSAQKSMTITVVQNNGPAITIGDTVIDSVGAEAKAIALPVPSITDVTGIQITEYTATVIDRTGADVPVSADKTITVADGKYRVTYSAVDVDGLKAEKTIILTVGESDDPYLSEGEEYLLNVSGPGDQLKFSYYTAEGSTKGSIVDDPSDLFNKLIYAENIKDIAINTVQMDTVNWILPTDLTRYSKVLARVGNPNEEAISLHLARSNDPSRYSGDPVEIAPKSFAWISLDLLEMSKTEDLTAIDNLWIVCGGRNVWIDRIKFEVNPAPVILNLSDTVLPSVGAEPAEVTLPVPEIRDAQQETVEYSVTVTDKAGQNVPVSTAKTITVADGMYRAVYTAADNDGNETEKTITITVGENPDYTLGENEVLLIDIKNESDLGKFVSWGDTPVLANDPQNAFNTVLKVFGGISEFVVNNDNYGGVYAITKDISAYSSVRLRVYNPNDTDIRVQFQNANRSPSVTGETVTVAPNTWEWIEFDLTQPGINPQDTNIWIGLPDQKDVLIDYLIAEKNESPVFIGLADTQLDSVGSTPAEITLPVPAIIDDKDASVSYTVTVKDGAGRGVDVVDGKITVADGKYEAKYVATDSDGNATERTVIISVGSAYELGSSDVLLMDVNGDGDLGKIRSWRGDTDVEAPAGEKYAIETDPTDRFNKVMRIYGAGITEVVINNDNYGGTYVIQKNISAYSSIRLKVYNPNDTAVRVLFQNSNRNPSVTGETVTVAPNTWEWIEFDLTQPGIDPLDTNIWIGLPDNQDILVDYLIAEKNESPVFTGLADTQFDSVGSEPAAITLPVPAIIDDKDASVSYTVTVKDGMNRDVDVVDGKITVADGKYEAKYVATDSDGNATERTIIISVGAPYDLGTNGELKLDVQDSGDLGKILSWKEPDPKYAIETDPTDRFNKVMRIYGAGISNVAINNDNFDGPENLQVLKKDLTGYGSVKIKVYNPNEEAVEVTLKNSNTEATASGEPVTVAPGTWEWVGFDLTQPGVAIADTDVWIHFTAGKDILVDYLILYKYEGGQDGPSYELNEKEALLWDVQGEDDLGKIRSWRGDTDVEAPAGEKYAIEADPSDPSNKVMRIYGGGITEVVINNDNFGGNYIIRKDLSQYSNIRIRIYNPNDTEIHVSLANSNSAPTASGDIVTVAPGTWAWAELDLTQDGIVPEATDVWILLPDGKDVLVDYLIAEKYEKSYELGANDVMLMDVNSEDDLGKIRSWRGDTDVEAPASEKYAIETDVTDLSNKVMKICGGGITEVVINNDNFGGNYAVGKDLSQYSSIRIKVYNPNESGLHIKMQDSNTAPTVTGEEVTVAAHSWAWVEYDLTQDGLNTSDLNVWISVPDGLDFYVDFLIATQK